MLIHKGTQTLETSRLILRRAVMEDAEPMFRNWASDPEVTKFLTWPAHADLDITRTVLKSWIEDYEKLNNYQWMIVLKENGNEPIGSICARSGDDRIGKAEIGYCLGKTWWRRGIMSEALAAVIQFLFAEIGMNRVESRHDSNNPNSGAVIRKCGMQYEGTFRQADYNNQGICDAAYYAILREDWAVLNRL